MSTVPEIRRSPGGVTQLLIPSPILSAALLGALAESLDGLAASAAPLVISSSHPRIFLAGADLTEIARLDAERSLPYARLGRRVLERLRRFPAPVVAAVHGPCAGGGLDLVLSCDAITAAPEATFAHPGVHRGLVTGWGGTAMFPPLTDGWTARRLFLEGRSFSAAEAMAGGWATKIAETPVHAAQLEALRLASLAPARLELWRRLRYGRFVDRFRVSVVHHCWRLFQMETGART